MAKYIERDALVEWLKHIPLKDLSDGLGLCRVIMEDDFKKAIKNMPKGIIIDVAPVRHGRWIEQEKYTFGTMYDALFATTAFLTTGIHGTTAPTAERKWNEVSE